MSHNYRRDSTYSGDGTPSPVQSTHSGVSDFGFLNFDGGFLPVGLFVLDTAVVRPVRR